MLYLRISDLTESLSCLLLSTLRLRASAMFGGMQRIYSFLQVCRSCYTDLQCIISTLSSLNIILLFIAFLLYSLRIFLHMSPVSRVQFIPVSSFLQCFYNIFSMSVSSAEKILWGNISFHNNAFTQQNAIIEFSCFKENPKAFQPRLRLAVIWTFLCW